jgi:putative DNA primase/helicase
MSALSLAETSLLDELMEQNTAEEITLKDYLEREQVGDAELAAARFRDRFAFDRSTRTWYIWRGNFWEQDRTGEVYNVVSSRLASEYAAAGQEAIKAGNQQLAAAFFTRARRLLTKHYVEDVLSWLAKQPGIALTGDEWDRNDMLLGVGNGMIDLRTGEYRTGQPREFMRFHSPIDWLGLNHPAPRWEQFVQEVFGCEVELQNYVQRAMGYASTGLTTERKFFMPNGGGANGKTVFFEAITYVLGRDYAGPIPSDAIMETRRDGNGPQPFIYDLKGKRMVIASESKQGRQLDGALVKRLTGNDQITAHTKYTLPITFTPSHKLFLYTNNLPHVDPEDQAIWDRIVPIPFVNRFTDDPKPGEFARDENLLETLKAEASGILAWLVRGCLEWQKHGLKDRPEMIKKATETYRNDEDVIADFLSECCYVGDNVRVGVAQLYESYKKWAEEGKENVMRRRVFNQKIARRFGEQKREGKGYAWRGVGELREMQE